MARGSISRLCQWLEDAWIKSNVTVAVSKARNATDSRSGQLQHSFSSVVSRSQCERFKRRLEDFHRKLSTFPGQGKSVVAVKDRLQSFSDTLETRMRVEGAQLILAAEAGLSAADSSLILNNASSRFHDCFTDATSCIVVVESEIGRCQEQTGFARQDVVELKRQVEEARREASRLREECQAIAATISTIDSEIEHLAEKEKRHRDQAKRNEDAAIAWGVGGLVLAPFTFGLSVVAAAPAAIVNVVNMEEHREKARDCESRKGDCQRSLSEKESQKSRWTSRIDDLSRECNQKETHIETLTAMTALLEELKTFLHNLSSSFDAARLTVGAMIEEMQSIRRGTQAVDTISRQSQSEHKGKWTFRRECLTASLQVKWDELVSFLKNYSPQ